MRSRGNLDTHEIRAGKYGALEEFKRQSESPTSILTKELRDKAEVSIGRTLSSAVIDWDGGLSISNTRSVVIVDAENTTRMVQFVFSTYAHGFTQVPSNFMNNEIGAQEDFEKKLKKTEILFGDALEAAALSTLETNKSQVIQDPLLYTEIANTLVAKFAQREEIIGDVNVVMKYNNFHGKVSVIATYGFQSLIRKLSESGVYNDKNKQYQYSDKIWNFSSIMPNLTGKYATGYFLNEDSVGVMWRHEREAVANTSMPDGTEWDINRFPNLDIPVSTYYYLSKGDFSAMGGSSTADNSRAMKEHYGFAVDACFVAAYISDSANRPTPILKVGVNREETDTDVTVPSAGTITSADNLNVTVEFSEAVATDKSGTTITGDIADLFTITAATPAGVEIVSAKASANGKSVVFVIADPSTNLAANDTINVLANSLYDGNGNAVVAGAVCKINAGATAWEATT